ncbi:hypothetical protein ACLBYD_15775 [Rhodococcus sp. C26F]
MTRPRAYQFIVDGLLTQRSVSAFPELQVSIDDKHGTTTLYGTMTDPTMMRSILARLDDLGLTLLEMRQLPG